MWIKKLISKVSAKSFSFEERYLLFRKILDLDRSSLEEIAKIEKIILEKIPCDFYFLAKKIDKVYLQIKELVLNLQKLNPEKYKDLLLYLKKIKFYLELNLKYALPTPQKPFVLKLEEATNPHLCGGKASSLAHLSQHLSTSSFTIPPGFVITTSAYSLFIKENQLEELIKQELESLSSAHLSQIDKVSATIIQSILNRPVPEEIKKEVHSFLENLNTKLAFRSSAYLEDSELSFAGQYESVLNISKENWTRAYKQVLASKYSPQAIFYRLKYHLPDNLTPMAVLVMPMLSPDLSGVIYTSLPQRKNCLAIYYNKGLGENLVGGKVKGDHLYLDKNNPQLSSSWIAKLFQMGIELENFSQHPLDIEWGLEKNKVFLLQARPFKFKEEDKKYNLNLPLLLKGENISPGLGTGKLFILKDLQKIKEVPLKSILFTPYLYPELTLILDKVEGIITLEGSAASHLSHIAREMQKPILRVAHKEEILGHAGKDLTLDAHEGKIYSGKTVLPKSPRTTSLPTLNKLLKHLSNLNLISTQEGFTPQNCQSLHDIIRFCHEMAVKEIFTPEKKFSASSKAQKLSTELPLTIYLIDLSKTATSNKEKEVKLSQINSLPFQVFYQGLSHPSIPWDKIPPAFDWDKFDQMSAGIFNPQKDPELNSFALIDQDYLHFLLRFGYHFVLVDSLIGEVAEQNYIQISFKGGGGLERGRLLRLKLLKFLLKNLHFQLESQGDFLKAELKKRPRAEMSLNLKKLGFLLGKTRLLDMHLTHTNYKQYRDKLKDELEKIT